MSDEESKGVEELELDGKKSSAGLMFVTVTSMLMLVALAILSYLTQTGSDKVPESLWVSFYGQLHPVVLHIPIGIFVLVFTMELGGLLSFGKWKPQTAFPLFVGVVGSVVAAIFGCLLLKEGDQPMEDAVWHMWGSVAFTVFATLAFLAKIWANHSRTKSPIYGIMLVVAMGLLLWSSHLGGVMTHGTDPLDTLQAAMEGKKEPETPKVVAKAPEERLAYEEVIVPIFHGKCYECHADADQNPAGKKKIKGKFVMTSMEDLIKGGSSGVPGITAGNLEDSNVHYTIAVTDDEDEKMPPPEKEQLEQHEIDIITWWIKAGAPVGKTMTEAGAPAEIIEGVAKLVPPEDLLKAQEEKAAAEAAAKAEEDAKRAKMAEAIDAVGKDFPNALRYVSQESTDLTFTAVSMRKDFTDEGVEKLLPVAAEVVELELGATSVGDSGVAHLASMPKLRRLKLNESAVTDAGLETVGKLVELEYLNLVNTGVTDEGLKHLEGLPKLRKLYLWQSKVTKEGAAALQEKLPDCEINLGL